MTEVYHFSDLNFFIYTNRFDPSLKVEMQH